MRADRHPDDAAHLRRLLAIRRRGGRSDLPSRSLDLGGAATRSGGAPSGSDGAEVRPDAAEVTGRAEAALEAVLDRMPPDEVGDPRDFRRALAILLRETQRAATKLERNPTAALSPGEESALEAVIRSDGTRPTLLVREHAVDPEHPLAGDWTDDLRATRDPLRDRIRAVGRIEPANPTARSYFGTGWVVDAGAGLVLTNLHVIEAMWQRLAHVMLRTGSGGFRVLDGAFIDFAAEVGATSNDRFRIVEAVPSRVDGPGLARLDAAVLKIEPTADGQAVPPAIPVLTEPDGPLGNMLSLCVVGFPGPPAYRGGVHEGVDWAWVNATLFGNRYGVKRLAPGITHRPVGSFPGDVREWVFGHDSTTLGGSSGSPVLAWLDEDPTAFGLHFAGASLDTNHAHAMSACADELAQMGIRT